MLGFLRNLFTRADTTTISRPARWLFEAFGAVPSASGITVNRQVAERYSAWWAAVSIISADVARLPLVVYRRDGDDRVKDVTNPLYRVLHDQPNSEMTSYTFRRTVQAHVGNYGNGLAYIDRTMPMLQLWPIDWQSVQMDRDRSTRQLLYRVQTEAGEVVLTPAEVIHVRGLSNDGLVGINLLQRASDSLGHGIAMQRFGARFFQNSACPRVIFEVPKNADPDAVNEFLADFQKRTTSENQHKATAIKETFKAHPLSVPAKDAQLIEAMNWSIRDIANWHQVPPHLLGDSSRTAYNSLAQENQSYLNRCLSPHLTNWEQELKLKLAPDDDSILIEHERRAVLDLDVPAQTQVFATALNRWLSADEIRRFMNLPPLKEPLPAPGPMPAPQPEPNRGGNQNED